MRPSSTAPPTPLDHLPPSAADAPASAWHAVRFYDDDHVLAEQVASYADHALATDGAAIVIASRPRLDAIARNLDARGHADRTRASGRLTMLEATDVLGTFMIDGAFDRQRFRVEVGGLLDRAARAASGGPIRAYGEMVDVLWKAGNSAAVLQLEDAWTELAGERPFSLLCGYLLHGFADARHTDSFRAICARHSHVFGEHVPAPGTSTDSLRAIAELEQRARSLEIEIQRRQDAERKYERLLAAETEARIAAEGIARRMAAVQRATAGLTGAVTIDEVARIFIEGTRDALAPRGVALWLLSDDGTALEMIETERVAPATRDRFARVGLEPPIRMPIVDAVKTGTTFWFDSVDEMAVGYPELAASLRQQPYDGAAIGCIPMIARGQAIGVISLTIEGRAVAPLDRDIFAVLADACAQATERARLYEVERRGRTAAERTQAETSLLYRLTDAVNQVHSVEEIYELAAEAIQTGIGVGRAAILLFDDAGVMRFKTWRGLSDEYRRATDGHSPWTRDAHAPEPVRIDDTETDEAWAAYRPIFRAEGIRALAFVPLVHRGVLLGKFMLYSDVPRRFDERELRIASAVAAHLAQAVTRKQGDDELARARAQDRAAREEAEAAASAREEILAIVSHDLRNPLGAILMAASSLQLLDAVDPRARRVRSIADRIQRNAERMTRLIEDLVDFASMQLGRLAVATAPHTPADVVASTVEMFEPLAGERSIRLEVTPLIDLPLVICDRERAVQVLSNLMSNALKVTAHSGVVQVGARTHVERTAEIEFWVEDSGPGIAADELPHLFERYWRGKQAGYRGTGLGLSIAKGIVDAHGGRIWAESTVGVGSRFTFTLPAAR